MNKVWYYIIAFVFIVGGILTFISPLKFDDWIGIVGFLLALILMIHEFVKDLIKWWIDDDDKEKIEYKKQEKLFKRND